MLTTAKSVRVIVPALLLTAALSAARAAAQETGPNGADEEKCEGPVYPAREVTRRAKITHRPEASYTEEARQNGVRGVVSLTAVLCRTGRVTEIKVVKGLPHGMSESAVEAVRQLQFTPAEKGGQQVSQQARFEYHFNNHTGQECVGDGCAGRLVEEVKIEGNRRLRDEEISGHIKTRPGEAYNAVQVRRDLQALLKLPHFDKTQTRVRAEIGSRDGVVVIFDIKELPLIRDVVFSGLSGVTETDVLKAFGENGIGSLKETPYDPAKITKAKDVILKLLAARGWPNATIDVQTEELSDVTVSLTFVIN